MCFRLKQGTYLNKLQIGICLGNFALCILRCTVLLLTKLHSTLKYLNHNVISAVSFIFLNIRPRECEFHSSRLKLDYKHRENQ